MKHGGLTFKQIKKYGSPIATKHLTLAGKCIGGKLIKSPYTIISDFEIKDGGAGVVLTQKITKAVEAELLTPEYAATLLGISNAEMSDLIEQGVLRTKDVIEVHSYDVLMCTYTGVKRKFVLRADVMHLRQIEETEEQYAKEHIYFVYDDIQFKGVCIGSVQDL